MNDETAHDAASQPLTWKTRLARLLNRGDESLDALRTAVDRRLDRHQDFVIVPYLGYGRAGRAFVHGRVLANPGDLSSTAADSLWDNLADMYRRVDSHELPYPRLRVTLAGQETELQGDEEGFFAAEIPLPPSIQPYDRLLPIHFALAAGDDTPNPSTASAEGELLLPAPTASFGVISDLDDTVLQSFATEPLRMLRTMFSENAHTRRPFAGVAAFYKALAASGSPLFYVSSSPWNLYDLLADFLALQGLPAGPLLLRDWGITESEFLPTDHTGYKVGRLRHVLDFYDPLPFLLIGDSGQQDPEIYAEIAAEYGERILGVLIRAVDTDPERIAAVADLGQHMEDDGRVLLTGDSSLALAESAARLGLIAGTAVGAVRAAQEAAEDDAA